MLEIWALMQCFVDPRGKLETYCRTRPDTTYFSEEKCDRARINLWRDGQCGKCKFDPLTHDLVDPSFNETQIRYSCRKIH